jgi:hypothetical protein
MHFEPDAAIGQVQSLRSGFSNTLAAGSCLLARASAPPPMTTALINAALATLKDPA